MEGQLNQQTGEYAINYKKDADDEYIEESHTDEGAEEEDPVTGITKIKGHTYEPREFMFCNMLHHTGLAQI